MSRTQQAQLEHDVDYLAALDAEDALIPDEDPPSEFGPVADAIQAMYYSWSSLYVNLIKMDEGN